MDRRAFLASAWALPVSARVRDEPKCKHEDVGLLSYSYPNVWKTSGILIPRPNETTAVVYGGRLLAISTPREAFSPVCVEVRDYFSGQLLASPAWSGIFGTATIDPVTGQIHVWGATGGSGPGNSVIHSSLDANFNLSTPDTVRQFRADTPDRVWNTSVSPDSSGFVMALETLFPGSLSGTRGFNIIFLRSNAITGPWVPIGDSFNYNVNPPLNLMFEAYCPTIKYHNGWYYLFYMQPDGQQPVRYNTFVCRSMTLRAGSWQFGPLILAADGPGPEQTNASDFDYAEFQGQCWGTYFAGDQVNSIPVKRCLIPMAEADFLDSLFP